MELWKTIKYFSDYEISNKGRIRSCKFNNIKILKIYKNNKGYLWIGLYKNGIKKYKFIHRLVLENFIGIIENQPFCNHIDGDKTNNKLENLEWVTQSENEKHASLNNLGYIGEKNGSSKLNNDDVKMIKEMLKTNKYKLKDISNKFSVSITTISDIKNNKIWKNI